MRRLGRSLSQTALRRARLSRANQPEPPVLKSQLESVRSAIELGIYNHCDEQPIQNTDIFLLRMVLHNHTNANAIRILAPLVRPLQTNPAVWLLIVDAVLPEPGDDGCLDEALQRYRDLTMQEVFNTRERSLTEFQRLLDVISDSARQLVVKNLRRSPASALSVIDVSIIPTRTDTSRLVIDNTGGRIASLPIPDDVYFCQDKGCMGMAEYYQEESRTGMATKQKQTRELPQNLSQKPGNWKGVRQQVWLLLLGLFICPTSMLLAVVIVV